MLRARALVLPALAGLALAASLAGACAGQPACQKNSDCAEGYCADGRCEVECAVSELDCPKGYFCSALGRCEYGGNTGGSGAGGATTTTTTTTTDTTSNTGTGGNTTTNSTTTSTGGGGSSAGGILDLCSGAGGCNAGLTCKALTKSGVSRCTPSCSSNAQCPAGTRCIDDGGGARCLGDDVGRSCTGATSCNFACITGPGYCTAECSSGSDCPNGYGCMPVGSPSVNVCVKAEALCDASDASACIAPAACDLSPNMILGGCTLACNTAADCPRRAAGLASWTCDGLCRRPGDVYGPLPGGWKPTEWYCNQSLQPVVLCNDAQHIDFVGFTIPGTPVVDCFAPVTTTGAANDSCVDSCRYQGGCAYGFSCVAVGSIGASRIGLCLPVGWKEPGATCSGNTECAFGYCVNGHCSRDCTTDGICPAATSCVAAGGPGVEGAPFRRCE